MKKLIPTLLAFLVLVYGLTACASKKFDTQLKVLKIETSWSEGFEPFPRAFVRVFDFEYGLVTDECVADEKDIPNEDKNFYNHPKQIISFTQEQAESFLKEVSELGFYTWEERYVTDEVINDAAGSSVTIFFQDGTMRKTYIFFEYPPNYKEISAAFESILGAKLYYEW